MEVIMEDNYRGKMESYLRTRIHKLLFHSKLKKITLKICLGVAGKPGHSQREASTEVPTSHRSLPLHLCTSYQYTQVGPLCALPTSHRSLPYLPLHLCTTY